MPWDFLCFAELWNRHLSQRMPNACSKGVWPPRLHVFFDAGHSVELWYQVCGQVWRHWMPLESVLDWMQEIQVRWGREENITKLINLLTWRLGSGQSGHRFRITVGLRRISIHLLHVSMDLSPAKRFCVAIGKCWHHGRVEADRTGSATRKRSMGLFEKDELEKWWRDHKGSCHQPILRQPSIIYCLLGCEMVICYKTRKNVLLCIYWWKWWKVYRQLQA